MGTADGFTIHFWGVRGTIPCTAASTMRYGGNTACVEMRCGQERLIFDAGTGLRQLGREMVSNGEPIRSHLFFTHTHMDHVIGLPFFRPAYDQRNSFEFWSGHLAAPGAAPGGRARAADAAALLPGAARHHACLHRLPRFRRPASRSPSAMGVAVRTAPLNHPGGAVAYRVDYAGRVGLLRHRHRACARRSGSRPFWI